jgi:endonuclease YncB( thermonuclease family)
MLSETYVRKAKILRVIDGDTLDVYVSLGFDIFLELRVRLAHTNTPEIFGVLKDSEEYYRGLQAKDAVTDWIKEQGESQVILKSFKKVSSEWVVDIWDEAGLNSLNEFLERLGYGISSGDEE